MGNGGSHALAHNIPRPSNAGRSPANVTGVSAGVRSNKITPNSFVYGTGATSRPYRAYGYGRGYRNTYRSSRSSSGYSQANNRAVVSRLRSVHASLARLDHDYQGHRVRSMHQISLAIRSLSHRSSGLRNGSSTGRSNVGLVANNGRRGAGTNRAGANNGRQVHLTQAQSDSRMGQALRTTQGIRMQLSHQGNGNSGQSRANGYLNLAIREMGVALQIR